MFPNLLWHTCVLISPSLLQREPYTDDEPYADEAQGPWGAGKPDASVRRFQSNLLEDPSGFRGWSTLTRSRSMESLPRREPVGTSALRELFESKNALQQDFASSPGLHATPPAKRTPATPTATPARKPAATGHGRPTLHSGEVTPAKREATRQVGVMLYICLSKQEGRYNI